MNDKSRKNRAKKCIAMAKVRRQNKKNRVYSGDLSGTLQIHLYPPRVPGKTWGLGVGPRGETPRIVTQLTETAEGVLEGEGDSPWMARRIRDNSNHKEWEIFVSASKA